MWQRGTGSRAGSALPSFERLLAAMIDFGVLLIPEFIIYELVWSGSVNRAVTYDQAHPSVSITTLLNKFPGFGAGRVETTLIVEAVTAVYLVGMYLFTGATLGKLVMDLRITRIDGTRLRPLDAVLRSLPFWVPLLIPGFGIVLWLFEYLAGTALVLWRPDHRGPEDLLGRSMVVRKESQGRPLSDLYLVPQPMAPPLYPPPPSAPRTGHLPGWDPGLHQPWVEPEPVPPVSGESQDGPGSSKEGEP